MKKLCAGFLCGMLTLLLLGAMVTYFDEIRSTSTITIIPGGVQHAIELYGGLFIHTNAEVASQVSLLNGAGVETILLRGDTGLAQVSSLIASVNITASGTLIVKDTGSTILTNSAASYRSNLLAATSISVGASPFNWTNTQTYNVNAFIGGGIVSAVSFNGGSVASGLTFTGIAAIPLQPNEYVTVTYSSAPTMNWHPW